MSLQSARRSVRSPLRTSSSPTTEISHTPRCGSTMRRSRRSSGRCRRWTTPSLAGWCGRRCGMRHATASCRPHDTWKSSGATLAQRPTPLSAPTCSPTRRSRSGTTWRTTPGLGNGPRGWRPRGRACTRPKPAAMRNWPGRAPSASRLRTTTRAQRSCAICSRARSRLRTACSWIRSCAGMARGPFSHRPRHRGGRRRGAPARPDREGPHRAPHDTRGSTGPRGSWRRVARGVG